MNSSVYHERPEPNTDVASAPKTSLIAELLEIQKHVQSAEHFQRWANDPICLRYDSSNSTCFQKFVNSNQWPERCVAVSWTSRPSLYEDPHQGKYTIPTRRRGKDGILRWRKEELRIRNSVLDRVVKYLQAFKMECFWIDKACINQRDSAQKARAINSMDLIYKEAERSIGLLSNPICTTSDAVLLASLLKGDLIEECSSGQFHFSRTADDQTICEAIRVLRCVVEDEWWGRAWIYQEEYLSGMRMDLLIPTNANAQAPDGFDEVGGEFCVQATLFREQSTMFLLACCASHEFRSACSDLLWKVEKFNITLKRDKNSLKPMSAFIFRDVLKRDLSYQWDRLAIIANACGYRKRLDIQISKRQERKLSHCLLALFLLNGEMFNAGCDHDMSLLDGDVSRVSRFLDQIQPSFSDLPVSGAGLTFLKYCRLPSVKLCEEGVETQGYIWELPAGNVSIDTADFDSQMEYEPWTPCVLDLLVAELYRREQPQLARKLREHLDEGMQLPATDYMDLMVDKLIQAINERQILRLANLPGKPASGIFITQESETNESMHVLTTWRPPRKRDKEQTGDAVSVRVTLRSGSPPVVSRIANWINGLVFFTAEENRKKKIVIEWPQSWKCQS